MKFVDLYQRSALKAEKATMEAFPGGLQLKSVPQQRSADINLTFRTLGCFGLRETPEWNL